MGLGVSNTTSSLSPSSGISSCAIRNARRVAKLERIIQIAQGVDDAETDARATGALQDEQQRSEAALERFGGRPPASDASAPRHPSKPEGAAPPRAVKAYGALPIAFDYRTDAEAEIGESNYREALDRLQRDFARM